MRNVVVVIAAAATAFWITKASAASLFSCNSADTAYRTVCNEQELRKLGSEIDNELARLLRNADSLTALLLKRDQVFFEEILAADNFPGFPGQYDKNYARILAVLKARRHALTQLRASGTTTLEGNWSNVFANVTITKAEAGTLTIAIDSRVSYDLGEVDCSALATATLGKDGWYSGTIGDKDERGRLDIIRFRLQGNTLRIVENEEVHVCYEKPEDGDRRAASGVLTGSYFPAGPVAKAAGAVTRPVAPSFDCAKAENADEKELCADPEMAQADRDIARLYGEVMQRVDRTLTGYLRADQRSWASDNSKDYLYQLHGNGAKVQYYVHQNGYAREHLFLRQRQRILLLANLDEKRKGIEGVWRGNNAWLTLAPAKGKGQGMLHAEINMWDVEDRKARCWFHSDGKIENGVFNAVDAFPILTRDGGTLVIDAEDASKHTEYATGCYRLHSRKAPLFAVKPNSGIKETDEGINADSSELLLD